ncbi:type VII secretion-associated serine protease [Rhodococcus sp. 06-156-3C]|uniref:type VII secretion-associated serine protease mycosin n=1 Tax=Nocardiaceae TaxID=85025 RepID=UPI000522E4AB|nr:MULTISPECIES: type VII secretion-associated serine protease mycosin [Rhodococcus]OZD07683.1 type VII secretion-associated serine protease [Rhodococcus sp. 06-156-4C]OZD17105.1 type VII secretion-associated serine protease [Rhodococcus sp. 06-156-3C]OZD18443.1 type VII secretion-associated serine protease [Rhodococcus sp. 06-156-4a]OZD28356.1 type VII secretion-associated serine protease [Rhodococcus sp. 06-156-3]OZD29875.1 type VII secretion-associated serine protease [Rhodococcus sp. 06-15
MLGVWLVHGHARAVTVRSSRRARARTLTVPIAAAMISATVGAGVASADRPVVDPGLLPEPGPAAPLDPTEQRNACVPVSEIPDGSAIPAELQALDFASVWPITRGAGQVVAVIDTGVSPHPRLPGLRPGGDYVHTGDGLSDCDAHGTLVAGLIAGSRVEGSGFAGGAPEAQILSIRQSSNAFRIVREGGEPDSEDPAAANASGYGNVMTMAMAVRTAADLGATVINISEVACVPGGTGPVDGPLGAAVEYAATVKDVVVVAAAGNTGGGGSACATQNPLPDPTDPFADQWDRVATIATPAWFDDQVLTVGSVNPDGSPAAFTLAGPWVDVAAPGTAITSLSPTGTGLAGGTIDNQGGVTPIQGTSFSAPLVAAVAALIRAHRPDLRAAQVIERIEATAHAPAEGWNPFVGHGVVDPLAAVTGQVLDDSAHFPASPVDIAAPLVPEPPDTQPRTVALTGAAAVGVVLVLGLGLSLPLRRRVVPHSNGSRAASGSGPTPS